LQNISIAFMKKQEWEKAQGYLRKWCELAPREATPLAMLSRVAFEQQQLERSVQYLNQAVELETDPDEKKSYLREAASLQAHLR
jgi:uncharacterized protein HemY